MMGQLEKKCLWMVRSFSQIFKCDNTRSHLSFTCRCLCILPKLCIFKLVNALLLTPHIEKFKVSFRVTYSKD